MNHNFDLIKARKETKACENIIHFNNAGSSLMPIPVSNALHNYLYEEEEKGGYETAATHHDLIENFYTNAAQLVNCDASEIAFCESATKAWQMAFYSFKFTKGDKILTTLSEYGSNVVAYNQQAKKYGVEIIFVPNDKHGQIDINALEQLIDTNVKLISISHIPTGGGLVNPAKAIGKIAKKHNIPFLLDACQSLGQIPVDVQEIGCDILCGTGRKYLRGPGGTGLLYVSKNILDKLEPPMLDQHAAALVAPNNYQIQNNARRFESWEHNIAGKVGLNTAIEYALSFGLNNIKNRIYDLAAILRQKINTIEDITCMDEGLEKCGIVTFQSNKFSPQAIKMHLAKHNINVSIADGSGPFVDYHNRRIKALVRASVHYYNTEEEIDFFINCLNKIA